MACFEAKRNVGPRQAARVLTPSKTCFQAALNPFWVPSVVRHAPPTRYTDSCGAPLGPGGEET